MTPPTKPPWTRPELIILGRGTSQENVLATCKTDFTAGPGRPAAQDCSKKQGKEPCFSLNGS